MAAGDVDAEAFRRLYPAQYLERFLEKSVRPDKRPLTGCRKPTVALNMVPTAEGSALVKIGNTTMLAGVKLEVMVPSADSADRGCLSVEFIMPPVCSAKVRPGRPAEETFVISEQLQNALTSSGLVDQRELSIISGKAAWMAYLDVYCLDSDGSLFDAALLASVAALGHLQLPAISVAAEGRVVAAYVPDADGMEGKPNVIKSRKLKLGAIPHALTIAMDNKYLIADPTAEEESILHTTMSVVVDSLGRLISFYKAGGSTHASTATVQDCLALVHRRRKEMQDALDKAFKEL